MLVSAWPIGNDFAEYKSSSSHAHYVFSRPRKVKTRFPVFAVITKES
jgi:hypothetical protein